MDTDKGVDARRAGAAVLDSAACCVDRFDPLLLPVLARKGSNMMTALARSGYSAPTRITVAAPMECPTSMGFVRFMACTNPTTSLIKVSVLSVGVNGSLNP